MGGRRFGVAYPALLGAVSLILLFGASIAPSGKWGLTALAGLGPCAAVASVGISAGFLCWGGAGLLALLLIPDRLCAVLFSVLFGLYPMVKALAERLKRLGAWLVKLAFFNAALTAVLLLMRLFLMDSLTALLGGLGMPALYVGGNVIFCIYDLGLTKLIRFYLARVDRAVRRSAGGRRG